MWRDRRRITRGSPTALSFLLVIGWVIAGAQEQEMPTEGGGSTCDLSPEDIEKADMDALKQFSLCKSFSPDQVKAILAVLSREDNPFGSPTEWTYSTLEELKGFFLHFDSKLMKQIPKSELLPWMHEFFRVRREKASSRSSRRKRAAECPPGKTVTQEVIDSDIMPIEYTAEELRACLKGPILAKNTDILKHYAFSNEQLLAIKQNLDEMFPKGYPSSITWKIKAR